MSARTQADRIFAELRSEILDCRMAPAEKINILVVCEKFGVSLGAAREALSRLISVGLVDYARQKGFSVAPVSLQHLEHLTDTRIEIEAICLRRSLAHGDLEWETQVVASYHRLNHIAPSSTDRPSSLSPEWSAAHATFHATLTAACPNKVVLRLRGLLHDESVRYRHWCLPVERDAGVKRDVASEHRAIMNAVLARDADLACALTRGHFQATTNVLLLSPMIVDVGTSSSPPRAKGRTAVPGN